VISYHNERKPGVGITNLPSLMKTTRLFEIKTSRGRAMGLDQPVAFYSIYRGAWVGGVIFGSYVCSRRSPPSMNHFCSHAANNDRKQNLMQYDKCLYEKVDLE